MSSLGQAFGEVSAIMSACAVVGVCAALVVQVRQAKVAQSQAVRTFHLEIMRLLLADPSLRPKSVHYGGRDVATRRRWIYANLTMKYFEMAYEIGYMSPEVISTEYATAMADDPDLREFWLHVRPKWVADATNPTAREFVALIDNAYTMAEAAAPDVSTQVIEDGRPANRRMARFAMGIAVGASVVAVIRARSARRRPNTE